MECNKLKLKIYVGYPEILCWKSTFLHTLLSIKRQIPYKLFISGKKYMWEKQQFLLITIKLNQGHLLWDYPAICCSKGKQPQRNGSTKEKCPSAMKDFVSTVKIFLFLKGIALYFYYCEAEKRWLIARVLMKGPRNERIILFEINWQSCVESGRIFRDLVIPLWKPVLTNEPKNSEKAMCVNIFITMIILYWIKFLKEATQCPPINKLLKPSTW